MNELTNCIHYQTMRHLGFYKPKPAEVFKAYKSFCCELFDVELVALEGRSRNKELVAARQYYCYLLKEKFGSKITLETIGKTIGRDHATVLHSIKECANRLQMDKWFNAHKQSKL